MSSRSEGGGGAESNQELSEGIGVKITSMLLCPINHET